MFLNSSFRRKLFRMKPGFSKKNWVLSKRLCATNFLFGLYINTYGWSSYILACKAKTAFRCSSGSMALLAASINESLSASPKPQKLEPLLAHDEVCQLVRVRVGGGATPSAKHHVKIMFLSVFIK